MAISARDRRPITLQLLDEIRAMIREGGMKPGDRLPSEMELSQRFEVARGSVREALKSLEQEGLVDVRHGSGRFVSASGGLAVNRPVTTFESVTEMLAARGFQTDNEVVSVERVRASAAEAASLHLPGGAEVVRLRRMRRFEGRVLIYSVDAFAASVLGDAEVAAEEFAGSLSVWLDERGRLPVSSVAQLQATDLPAEVADLPGVEDPRNWLLITERSVDAEGRPALHSMDYHRGDTFSFHVLRRRGA